MHKRMKKHQKNKNKGQWWEDKVQKTLNSGSLWFCKGDLQTDTHLIECKYTDKKGFRVSTKILQKLWDEALTANKFPALIIGIKDDKDDNIIWTLNINIERRRK